jgi:NAD(P)-dependent dehydrogenase (short-subunit alcohol dehydrogenase family)
MRDLDGRVAVVTGGIFGVGRGIASALAQYGARLFVTGRSANDSVANEEQITGIRCDYRVELRKGQGFVLLRKELRRAALRRR